MFQLHSVKPLKFVLTNMHHQNLIELHLKINVILNKLFEELARCITSPARLSHEIEKKLTAMKTGHWVFNYPDVIRIFPMKPPTETVCKGSLLMSA